MSTENKNTEIKMFSLKEKYAKVLELSMIASLMLLISAFFSFRTFEGTAELAAPDSSWKVDVVVIPQTIQNYKKPKPTLPRIPVASDEDEALEDVDIDFGNYNIEELLAYSAPPEMDDEEEYEFIGVSEKPQIIKKVAPVYPDLARKAGISGMVTVKVLIGKNGRVEKTELLKSIAMLDEAALIAAKQCIFKPGKQRDKYVRVWMAIPFQFRLR